MAARNYQSIDALNSVYGVGFGGFTWNPQTPTSPKTVGVRYFQEQFGVELPKVVKVIYNEPATIVFWSDNTKTVVKCGPDDTFNPEVGLAMAVVKKYYADNNTGEFHRLFKKFVPKEKSKKVSAKPVEATNDCPACPDTETSEPVNVADVCRTCKYKDTDVREFPCSVCLRDINHPLREAKEPVVEDRICCYCKHAYKKYDEFPCNKCDTDLRRTMFEAK